MIQEKDSKMVHAKPNKRVWEPIQPERKSKRVPLDGDSMLEKAQALKRKNNLEIDKGKKVQNQISTSSLLEIASGIDLSVPVEELVRHKVVNQVLELEMDRNNSFSSACSFVGCHSKIETEHNLTAEGSQKNFSSEHIGCSYSVVNSNPDFGNDNFGANSQEDVIEGTRGLDPKTPDGRSSGARDLNILEAEIEKAWTKVVNRKKSKKKK
jgi:hypothetical protein